MATTVLTLFINIWYACFLTEKMLQMCTFEGIRLIECSSCQIKEDMKKNIKYIIRKIIPKKDATSQNLRYYYLKFHAHRSYMCNILQPSFIHKICIMLQLNLNIG